MRFIIGFVLILFGGVLGAVTGFFPFIIILFVGVFLFASFTTHFLFCDYVIVNSEMALFRKRYYIHFIPFVIMSYIITFKKATLSIVWKEEYFIAPLGIEDKEKMTKISRKEYIALRNEQRKIYSTQLLSKEFMERSYSESKIGFKRKKARLIAVIIICAVFLTMVVYPGGIFITLIYEAIFVPMIILWIPEYKDAKILQQAYNKAINGNTTKTMN